MFYSFFVLIFCCNVYLGSYRCTGFAPTAKYVSRSNDRSIALQNQSQKQRQRQQQLLTNRFNAKSQQVDDWEVAEFEEAPPRDIEKFLSSRYPEFFYLLQKNDEVMSVIRGDASQRQSGITLFAPNAQAFQALGTKRLTQLEDERNLETAEKMAAYHVIATESVSYIRLFTEDWTKGRPKDGGKPAFTIEGIATMGGNVPVGRAAQDEGWFGTGWFAKRDGEVAVIGTNNARVLQSFTSKKEKWIVHEMSGLISPELLWRYMDQLRIPGF
ncbi:hypothetical protein ACA910_002588 [Epithemia clementina (nom. ined.)]